MKMKKLCLLIALCAFSYAVKGAAADDQTKITNDYAEEIAILERAEGYEGYEEERAVFKDFVYTRMLTFGLWLYTGRGYGLPTCRIPLRELILHLPKAINLYNAAPLFLTPNASTLLRKMLCSRLARILGTPQIEDAVLDGDKELLDVLKRINALNIEDIFPQITLKLPAKGTDQPLYKSELELLYTYCELGNRTTEIYDLPFDKFMRPTLHFDSLRLQLIRHGASLQQVILLNALGNARQREHSGARLTPELMDCLATLPPIYRPRLTKQDACTVLFTRVKPYLDPTPIDQNTCPICLENLTTTGILENKNVVGRPAFTACNHCFHAKCISTALRANASCPLCRAPQTVIQQDLFSKRTTMRFEKLERAIRTNPFITLPQEAEEATTDFKRDFLALPLALKKRLQDLQRELHQTLETTFAAPVATEPQAAAAAADEEAVASTPTPTEPVLGGAAGETREERRERLATAAFKRLQLQEEQPKE